MTMFQSVVMRDDDTTALVYLSHEGKEKVSNMGEWRGECRGLD
ncbi:hypothetical protein SAMN04488004_1273 [Loktanella salsilacus]|uniref:Uncharacterized protein n=1 Tax=Loktanella salsilacus TaxID=195913 RepID=A0A1I4IJR0_9RHOB|nr:hypothetical protein SAMN04488004_1273 [Loktanella salsilacus]